jgi:NADH dehydrogenase (ubiquinone) Fe-S protein 2
VQEFRESLRIIGQVSAFRMTRNFRPPETLCQCLNKIPTGPVKVDDHKLVPPPRASMKESMESLIHHFKVSFFPSFSRDRPFSGSTDLLRGIFRAPGRDLRSHRSTQRRNGRLSGFVSLPRAGIWPLPNSLFFHFDSDGTNRPYRCSIRAPGFAHLAGADFMMRREYP